MSGFGFSGKLSCKDCGHFLGIVSTDGKVPILDECQKDGGGSGCRMMASLAKYQPKRRPLGCGKTRGCGHLDSDSGGYQSIAIRAMEDGNDASA